jgi:protocatechuate 3,4-dioxygenase beta subunit
LLFYDQQSGSQLNIGDVVTDSNGYYEVRLGTGEYKIRPYQNRGSTYPGFPNHVEVEYMTENLIVSSDLNLDFTMPFYIITGKVVDNNGVSVPGAHIQFDQSWGDPNFSTEDIAVSSTASTPMWTVISLWHYWNETDTRSR